MKKIVLTPNPYRDRNFKYVTLADKLLREAGLETRICLAFDVDRSFELPDNVVLTELNHELRDADLLVCFGGDGTILHASKAATKAGIPVLGVNIGTMGFMAELEASELHRLPQLATGDFTLDNRMMLDVTVQRDRDIIFHDICLNDVVVTKGAVARIVYLSVECDGTQAMTCGGDGVIVATPSGSTAYSLSAGGPIVEPDARNIIITPICAHDMVSRCVVASDRRVVTVRMAQNARRNAYLSVDGGKALRLNMGDVATIRKSRLETKLVKLNDRSFYDVVNAKFQRK